MPSARAGLLSSPPLLALPLRSGLGSPCSLVLAFILSCITYLWHWGQKKKLQYIRDNKILLRDLYEVDPAGPTKAGDGGAGVRGRAGRAPLCCRLERISWI